MTEVLEVTEDARERVAKLALDWDWPEPEVLKDILALGAEAVPALAELLTPERLQAEALDEEDDSIAYYALELLAALETPTAIPVFLHAYRQISDDMAAGMEQALQRLGPDATEPMLAIAADPSLTPYTRGQAANGAMHQAHRDSTLRQRVAEVLREVLAGYIAQTEPLTDAEAQWVGSLVGNLAQLADPLAKPLIDTAFANGLMQAAEQSEGSRPTITQKAVEQLYREGGRHRFAHTPPYLEEYGQRRQRNQEYLRSIIPLKPVVLGAKLGRNDPCRCGSGKKYKKCHLAEDEKEKVRL